MQVSYGDPDVLHHYHSGPLEIISGAHADHPPQYPPVVTVNGYFAYQFINNILKEF